MCIYSFFKLSLLSIKEIYTSILKSILTAEACQYIQNIFLNTLSFENTSNSLEMQNFSYNVIIFETVKPTKIFQ